MRKIMVLGAGGFGTSLSVMLDKVGEDVTMWSSFQNELDEIRIHGENRKLLPGINVPPTIRLSNDIDEAMNADIVIFAVPSSVVRIVAKIAKGHIKEDSIIVNVGKGFEEGTQKRLSEVLTEEFPNNEIVVLSGPSHAEEIARGIPTTLVAASKNKESAEIVQDLLMNTNLRVYVNNDIIGVELGGALKNIIALCAGISDGMGLGDNTKAALMTRGMVEISRLGVAMGAHIETFGGLTGIGDLIVTCTSMHSRNRRAGIYIGEGMSMKDAIEKVGMTVEGCVATKAAYELSVKYNVDMPIVKEIYNVLYKDKTITNALADLMGRPRKSERETIWINVE